jgi:hypothetical protein
MDSSILRSLCGLEAASRDRITDRLETPTFESHMKLRQWTACARCFLVSDQEIDRFPVSVTVSAKHPTNYFNGK